MTAIPCWGHRGGQPDWPENSLAAFEAALRGGCDAIEADIRMLNDGVLICHHDPTFGHTVCAKGAVRDWSWFGGVDRLRLRDPPHGPLPRFEDVLALLLRPEYDHIAFNIDVKAESRYDVVFAALHAAIVNVAGSDYLRTLAPRLWLSIYTPWHLVEAERWMPYAKRAHLGVDLERARQVWDRVDGFSMAFHNLVGPDGDRFRAEVRRAGKALVVWTVNAPHEWLECARWGVDAIITDRNADYRAWQRRLAGDERQLKQMASAKTSLSALQRLGLVYLALDNQLWQRSLLKASLADVVHLHKTNPPSPPLLAEKMAGGPDRIDELVLPAAAAA